MERVLGIARKQYPQNEKNPNPFYELLIRRGIEDVNADKYKKSGVGFDTEIPYLKSAVKMDPVYAQKLIDTGAFVPDRDYEFVTACNPDDVYEMWISELVPVDDEIKKHFAASLNNK
ncbi:VSK-int [Vibrionales bacterium C3R12]|nr:VSK-int [Vibrionales bacterium C3R12]